MKSILDTVYGRMLEEGRGLTEREILKTFFRVELASDEMAARVVRPLLSGDARFRLLPDRSWGAVKRAAFEKLPISETVFVLFAIDEPREADGGPGASAASPRPAGPGGPGGERGSEPGFGVAGAFSSFLLYKNGAEVAEPSLRDILHGASRCVFVPHDSRSLARLKKMCRAVSPVEPDLKTLSVKTLISLLHPEKKLKTWEDIVGAFSLVSYQSEGPASRVTTLKHLFEFLLGEVQSRGFTKLEDLLEFQERAGKQVDFSRYGFGKEFLRDIPELPGVYLFRDRGGKVVYAGKTNNLRVRVRSYFWNTGESPEKVEGILGKLHTIEYRVLGSDLEAMIEEYRLIDAHRPEFNTRVKIPERPIEVPDTILILPSSAQGKVKLYLLTNSLPLREFDYDCERGDDGAVLDALRSAETAAGIKVVSGVKAAASGKDASGGKDAGSAFDPLKVLALFYLRKYDENLNVIDVARYGSAADVVKALRMQCRDKDSLFREKAVYVE